MSTNAIIARTTGKTTWEGRYHHWDGYPSGLGKTLWTLYRGHFEQDLGAMLKVLIDDHPAGWSTINGADWSLAPGYGGDGPQCYCHGKREEEGMLWVGDTSKSESPEDYCPPYLYVFSDDESPWMRVYRFEYAARRYKLLKSACLKEDEPDWKAMDSQKLI